MPSPYYNTGYPNYYNPYAVAQSYGYRPQMQTWSPTPNYYQQPTMPQDSGYSQQAQIPQQPQQTGAIKWVYSEKEVADEYVAPNGAVTLWNANEPVIYLKQADATGKPTIKTYDLVERVPVDKSEEAKSDYATAADLTALAGVVKQMNENMTLVGNELKNMSSMSSMVESLRSDIDAIKSDMYGIAGKKKVVRKAEVEEDG